MPRFAVDSLLSASAWKPPELLTSLLAGATSTFVLASGAGLLIGLGLYAGLGVWHAYRDKTSSPNQFLSRIEAAGASLAGRPVPAR